MTLKDWLDREAQRDPNFAWWDEAAVDRLIAAMPPDVRAEHDAAVQELYDGLDAALQGVDWSAPDDDVPEEPER